LRELHRLSRQLDTVLGPTLVTSLPHVSAALDDETC
jgi:hypothetical protein